MDDLHESSFFNCLLSKFLLYLLKIIFIICYNLHASKHGTDLFQIIQSVKMAFTSKTHLNFKTYQSMNFKLMKIEKLGAMLMIVWV